MPLSGLKFLSKLRRSADRRNVNVIATEVA